MKEKALFISWGQIPRGREATALNIFKKAHDFLKKKKDEGKINFSIYFNAQSAELAGFMLIHGKPEFLQEHGEELERLYMQAASVVDNLSSKIMVGGTEEGVLEHLGLWGEIQREIGLLEPSR
jgi:hypothetical protein